MHDNCCQAHPLDVRDAQAPCFHPPVSVEILFVAHAARALHSFGRTAQQPNRHVFFPESCEDYLIRQSDFPHPEISIDWIDFSPAIHDWMVITFHEPVDWRWTSNDKKSSRPCSFTFVRVSSFGARHELETITQILTECPIVHLFHTCMEHPSTYAISKEHCESIPPTITIDALASEHSLIWRALLGSTVFSIGPSPYL